MATLAADPLRDVFVARQPICDADRKTLGYELLVGGAAAAGGARAAGAQLLIDVFAELGLETLTGDRPAFLALAPEFLLDVYPLPLRPDRVVLELDGAREPEPELLGVLARLGAQGFTFALRRADPRRPELEPLLALASWVKLNLAELAPGALEEQAAAVRGRGAALVAERVETPDELERCRRLGFTAFQGPVLALPRVVRGRRLPTARLGALRLLADLQAPDADLPALETVIRSDVGLSYKLLRYVNSAFFSLPHEIDSVGRALVLLGERLVRRWATVMVLHTAQDSGHELLDVGLVRARMCEGLAGPGAGEAERCFTAGLFSVLDALLGAPMREILAELPVAPEIRAALLGRDGPVGEVLGTVLAYERGDFAAVRGGAGGARPRGRFTDAALAWTAEVQASVA